MVHLPSHAGIASTDTAVCRRYAHKTSALLVQCCPKSSRATLLGQVGVLSDSEAHPVRKVPSSPQGLQGITASVSALEPKRLVYTYVDRKKIYKNKPRVPQVPATRAGRRTVSTGMYIHSQHGKGPVKPPGQVRRVRIGAARSTAPGFREVGTSKASQCWFFRVSPSHRGRKELLLRTEYFSRYTQAPGNRYPPYISNVLTRPWILLQPPPAAIISIDPEVLRPATRQPPIPLPPFFQVFFLLASVTTQRRTYMYL